MNNIVLVFLSIVIITINNVSAKEVSVFGAGDLESDQPYGLTKAEKAAHKNSNKIKDLSFQIHSILSKQEEIKQEMEGVKSVFNSDSKNLSSTKNKLNDLTLLVQELNSKMLIYENKLEEFITLQKQNNKVLEESNLKLLNLINEINNQYISRKEFDELVQFVNKKSSKSKKSLNNSKNNFGFKSNDELYNYAVKMHKKNYLTKTMPMFYKLVEDNYKKASSSYYLADILHFKKKYKDAIHYYKQSMMMNDSASYIPDLLFNSADAFEKLGDKVNAKNFYETLIDAYANTEEAKKAIIKLQKLN